LNMVVPAANVAMTTKVQNATSGLRIILAPSFLHLGRPGDHETSGTP
jgi:hypothetical protein